MFAEILADHGFQVVGIMAGRPDEVSRVTAESHFTYPVIADDGRLGILLNASRHEYFVLLLDGRRVVFSSENVQPDDLRQICERYVLGSIRYFHPAAPCSCYDMQQTIGSRLDREAVPKTPSTGT